MPTLASLLPRRKPLSMPADATAFEASRFMTKHGIGAVLVTENDATAGIFTERDLMVRVIVADLDPAKTTIGSVMTRELYTAHTTDKIADVRVQLQKRHIRHLPVLQGDEPVALLSLRDLLRADLLLAETELRDLTQYVQRSTDTGLG